MAVHFAVTGHAICSRDGVAKRDGGRGSLREEVDGRAWVAWMFPDGGKRLSNTGNVIHESALEIYRTRMWDRVGRARGSVRNVTRRSDEKVSGAHPNKNKKQKTRAEMKANDVKKASRT